MGKGAEILPSLGGHHFEDKLAKIWTQMVKGGKRSLKLMKVKRN